MDIHSLAIFTGITNLIQVIALLMQYKIDKNHKGIGCWVLGSVFFSLGFLFNLIRDIPTLVNIAIVANNILFIAGMYMFYWGIVSFFNKKNRHGWLLFFCCAIVLIAFFFTYLSYNLFIRRLNLSIGVSVISFLIARFIYCHKKEGIIISSNFLAILFTLFGWLFLFRFLYTFFDLLDKDLFALTAMQEITYLGTMIATSLWTIGFILLVNQQLVSEKQKSKENLKQIFETSPYGTIISRIDDGLFVNVNLGFTNLTGFSFEEINKKSSFDIQLWKNPEDWKFLIKEINENGFVNNFESVLFRKDRSSFFCLISATPILLDDEQFILIVIHDITKLKKVEKNFYESEEKYRLLAENSSDVIWVLNLSQQKFTYISPAIFRLRGLTVDEALNENMNDALTPESIALVTYLLNRDVPRFIENPDNPLYSINEVQQPHKNGSLIWVEISSRYRLNKCGEIEFVGISRNIDGRKKLEQEHKIINEKLHESELRYRMLVETAHEGILVYKKNHIMFANRMMEEITGYGHEELLKLPFFDIVDPEDKQMVEQNYLKRINGESVEPLYRFRIRTKDNSVKWIELSGTTIDWEGESAALTMITDYTRRNQVEVALKQREINLAETQRMAHIGNWENDLINQTVFWSAEMFRIYDVNPEGFDKKSESLLKLIHPEDIELFKFNMNTDLVNGDPVSFEYRIIHKDKSVHNLMSLVTIHVDDRGKPIRQIGTIQDITKRKEAEKEKVELEQMQQLNEYVEKARENERAAIARDLHDDLGQSLTAVKIDLGLIKQKVTDEKISIKLNNVYTMVGNAIKSVQTITAELRPEIIEDLGLQAAIEWYAQEFEKRNKISVNLDLDPKICLLPDDSLGVFRIMQESLTNISRHANATNVDITLIKVDDSIQLIISDDGGGITEKQLNAKSSFGLIGMRERASRLGGVFQISAATKHGTVINLIFQQKIINTNPEKL